MTRRQIDTAVAYWRRVLKLEDWDIVARTGTKAELTQDGEWCSGLNYIHPEELLSTILLKRGESEETLVHELLHVVFDGDKPQDGPYDCLHERALNRTAAALMLLKERVDD